MKKHDFIPIRKLIIVAFAMTAICAKAATNVQYSVLARNGDPAPGIPGATFAAFSAPIINRGAEVFFGAQVTGGGVATSNDYVLVAGHPGAWTNVAREGDSVAGLPPDVRLKTFANLRLNDAGFLAFVSTVGGAGVTSTNDTCFVWGRPGDLRVIAREADPVPGATQGEIFDDLGSLNGQKFAIGGSNDVGFVAKWRGPTSAGINAGVWLGPATNLILLLRDGNAAPDMPGHTMRNLQFATARLNPEGVIAFDCDTSLSSGIWAGTTNGLRAIWRGGDPITVPGTTTTFRSFYDVTVNGRTQYCFAARLNGVPSGNDTVILAGTQSNLQLMAREGYHAPGMPDGVVFTDLGGTEPLYGARGDVAFVGTVSGPGIGTTNDTAIWVGQPGALRMVNRRGDPATDMATGIVYSTSYAATFSLGGLNASGAAVFMSKVQGTGIGLSNDEGLWGGVPGFETLLLQREDHVDLGDALPHLVHMMNIVDISGEMQIGGGQDGRARSLNDANQYVVSLNFKAGQGSALVLIEDVQDADLNGLNRVLEHAHGVPLGGNADHADLWFGNMGNGFTLRFQEASATNAVSLVLREADGIGAVWQNAGLSISNAVDQSGVDAGAVRREAQVPANPGVRFYRLEAVIQNLPQ